MSRILDFSDGFTTASTPTQGTITFNALKTFANDAAFVTDKGSAAAQGDIYKNTTSNVVRQFNGSAWIDLINAPTSTTDNTVARYDSTAGQVQSSGVTIDDSNNVVIPGNLTVNGTTTVISTATLDVEDQNIVINDGGNDASSEGAGLTVERTGTAGSLVYADALASKFKIGAVGSEAQVATVSHTQTFTNKTLTSPVINTPDIDGGTASNTSRITLSKASKATIDGLTRKEATLWYASDEDKVYYDDGSTVTALASATAPNSFIRLHTGSGHGSTNTKIRRFATTLQSVGTDITYADSATNGASFTINTTGIYAIHYQDTHSADSRIGLSLNSSELTTSIGSITETNQLAFIVAESNTNTGEAQVSYTGRFSASDVIRPHTDGSPANATSLVRFTIIRIA